MKDTEDQLWPMKLLTKILDFARLLHWAESTVVTVDIGVTASAVRAVELRLCPVRRSVFRVHSRELGLRFLYNCLINLPRTS